MILTRNLHIFIIFKKEPHCLILTALLDYSSCFAFFFIIFFYGKLNIATLNIATHVITFPIFILDRLRMMGN